jgi:hypothetical protein
MKSSHILGLLSALLVVSSSGCVIALGNSGTDKKATTGQELVDLQKAKDAGAINEEDYQAQKKAILNKH